MNEQAPTSNPVPQLPEQPVRLVPLALDIDKAQISGLAWHGDNLVILPQYPNWQGTPGDGCVQVLDRAAISAFLYGVSDNPVVPWEVPFITSGLEAGIPGFQGYEAMAIVGDRVFVTVEAELSHNDMLGYIVAGTVESDLSAIRLHPETLVSIKPQARVPNASYETLVYAGDRLIAIYEANGVNVNPQPEAYVLDLEFNHVDTVPFPQLEYRITDATPADEQGRFWAINFYWPGDKGDYTPGPDQISARWGMGPTHARTGAVERLVQFQYTESGITLVDRPPVPLRLLDAGNTRNWEGLVPFGDEGFLIITDEFPETLLGFVEGPRG
jgi:hypothetical protein